MERERQPTTRDVTLGLVVTGARLGAAAGRLVLLPVRVAAKTPVVGTALRRAGEELSADADEARERGRRRLEDAAGEILTAPEVERTIDTALASPLTEAVARSAADHRVAERVAAEIVSAPEFEEAIAAALDHEATRRLVDRALASPGLEQLVADAIESRLAAEVTDRLVQSPEFQQLVGHVAASPEVRTALAKQTSSLAEEMVAGVRGKTRTADDSVEHRVRRWLHRAQRTATDYRSGKPPYGGVASRAVALAFDALLALVIAIGSGATLALIGSLVVSHQSDARVVTYSALWWLLVSATYFVLFWSTAGQTPGLRLMRLRVLDGRDTPPSLLRSIVRYLGLQVSIAVFFLGFVPVLFDERRRSLADYVAGTTVHDEERLPAYPPLAAYVSDAAPAPPS